MSLTSFTNMDWLQSLLWYFCSWRITRQIANRARATAHIFDWEHFFVVQSKCCGVENSTALMKLQPTPPLLHAECAKPMSYGKWRFPIHCLGHWLWRLTWIAAWIGNYMHSTVRDEITDPFPNFNYATVEVWECKCKLISSDTLYTYIIHSTCTCVLLDRILCGCYTFVLNIGSRGVFY